MYCNVYYNNIVVNDWRDTFSYDLRRRERSGVVVVPYDYNDILFYIKTAATDTVLGIVLLFSFFVLLFNIPNMCLGDNRPARDSVDARNVNNKS